MTTNLSANQPVSATIFSLDAGHPGLDFANTLEGRNDPQPGERLPDYDALIAFARQAGLLDDAAGQSLAARAAQRPHEARAAHAAALVLREAVFRVSYAVASGQEPESGDLRVIGSALAAALSHGDLACAGASFGWEWGAAGPQLEYPLWPIAYATFELLTQADLSRLRVCAAGDCDWLFLDETRNRSRKWCDMGACGNRAKVARYRRREQGLGIRD